jgi:hypothetical protein
MNTQGRALGSQGLEPPPSSAAVGRARAYVVDKAHDAARPHVFKARRAEHREELPVGHADAKPFGQVFLVEGALIEEFFHQALLVFRGGFHQGAVHGVGPGLVFGGDGLFLGLAPGGRELVHHHAQCIDDGIEARAGLDRELQRQHAGAEAAAGLVEGGLEVGLLVVEVVDHEQRGRVELFDVFPHQLGADLHPAAGVEHHYGGVGHFQGGDDLAGEIVEPRRVEDVDLGVFPGAVQQGAEERVAALLFERGIIALGVAVADGAAARYGFCFVEHGFGKGGLTASGMSNQDHIPDLTRFVGCHEQMMVW